MEAILINKEITRAIDEFKACVGCLESGLEILQELRQEFLEREDPAQWFKENQEEDPMDGFLRGFGSKPPIPQCMKKRGRNSDYSKITDLEISQLKKICPLVPKEPMEIMKVGTIVAEKTGFWASGSGFCSWVNKRSGYPWFPIDRIPCPITHKWKCALNPEKAKPYLPNPG